MNIPKEAEECWFHSCAANYCCCESWTQTCIYPDCRRKDWKTGEPYYKEHKKPINKEIDSIDEYEIID